MRLIDSLRRINHQRLDAIGKKQLDRIAQSRQIYLQPEDLEDVDLAIVGPASTVVDELCERPLSSGTWVCRMNRSLAQAALNPAIFGTRTDILFHNFNFEGPRSAGPIDTDMLLAQRVRFLVFPHSEPRQAARKISAILGSKTLSACDAKLRIPPFDMYQQLIVDLGNITPTAGLVAIAVALNSPLSQLSIYGFTFFQTPYVTGYNDDVKSGEDALKWARGTQIHDPAKERQWLIDKISAHRAAGAFPIILGNGVAQVLDLPPEHDNDRK
jgi:hypothetical protein